MITVKIEMSDRLNPSGQITVWTGPASGQILTSPNTQYTLILQADSSYTGLTMWLGPQQHSGTPVWQTPLFPPGSQPSRAVMEPNGDFVVYDTSNTPLWRSDTAGHPGAYVVIQNDGLLVVYDPNSGAALPLWASDGQTGSDGTSWNTLLGTQQVGPQGAGVMGVSHDRYGVFGYSRLNDSIHGETDGAGAAIAGIAMAAPPPTPAPPPGLAGYFQGDAQVTGTLTANGLNILSINWTKPSTGCVHDATHYALKLTNDQNGALFASGNPAGHFEGNVEVTGEDFAEDFDISTTQLNVEPGTVMVLDEKGGVVPSHMAYDKKVAGVISGAGGYRSGIILGRQQCQSNRLPIALMGKVYCKVDATRSSIEIGDLLTTSPKKGHAMKANDPYKAFGAVVGKALGSIKEGIGIIPILVALQ